MKPFPTPLALLAAWTVGGLAFPAFASDPMIPVPKSTSGRITNGAPFSLGQPWAASLEKNFRTTNVRLSWSPDALKIHAKLEDNEVVTSAKRDNDRLWELGDVFEIFVKMDGRNDYAELHIAPNGVRMHLKFPGVGGKATPTSEPVPFEQLFVSPPAFRANAVSSTTGWQVDAEIPASVVGLASFEAGQILRISFSRYDAATDGSRVLSTSAAHPVVAFHRPDEWSRIVLENQSD